MVDPRGLTNAVLAESLEKGPIVAAISRASATVLSVEFAQELIERQLVVDFYLTLAS